MPLASPTTSTRRDRVLPLDGLRTVAIAFVVLYHLHVPGFGSGFVGVNVFFVLSGYLITTLLLGEHARTGRIRLGRFWVRRILRLYPTLLAVVVVGVALWWLIGDYQGSTMSALGAAAVALTYTGNVARSFLGESQGVFSPMWSLSMEEQFYIVWPPLLMLLIAVVATRRVMVAVLGALVVASVVASGFLFEAPGGGSTPDIYFSPVLNVAPLLLGCGLALVMGSEKGQALFRGRLGSVATWVGLAGVVGSLAAIGSGWQQNVTTFTVMLPGVAIASALLIGGLVSRPSLPARVLSLSPVAWFGRALSYPIYLWHVVFIALITPVVPGALGVVAVIAASVVTAYLSHRFVEGPALRLKDRLGTSAKEARSTTPAERELTNA
ncbi:peptidoglycan/LPS O-acetylase OafA/YrhL [Frigoribacterium sp. PhB107]|uniref:acyltransferase family protein n=1 Tax=Frigoribacterium sp. PhB107 TaxID=2485172 RepID=UPI000F460341|nr:acyltransferase [Frigoribacterium sp. PhB107]ROP78570.1 peptidoglycan/LPS O-acetylase OafA/YrhL [Frigoribacterium sp. PhB107]